MAGNKRIIELPLNLAPDGALRVPVYNPATDDTEQIVLGSIMAEDEVEADAWNPEVEYDEGDIRSFDNQVWISQQDANIGVTPGTDEDFWVLGTAASNRAPWGAGVFSSSFPTTLYDFGSGYREYYLNPALALPYNSVDFESELSSGDWIPLFNDGYWPLAGTSNLTGDVTINAGTGEHFDFFGSGSRFNVVRNGNRTATFNLDPEVGGFGDGGLYFDVLDPSFDEGTRIRIDDVLFVVGNDSANNFAGIQYDIDYSADFTARSLVDKGYVDGLVVGTFWPLSGSADFGGQIEIEGSTGDEGTTLALHNPGNTLITNWSIQEVASGDAQVSNTLDLTHPDFELSQKLQIYNSSGALAQWRVKDKFTSGESYLYIDSDLIIRLVPAIANSSYAEMNTGRPGSGDEDKGYIRLYGLDGPGIEIFGDDDTPISFKRNTDISGDTWTFEQLWIGNGSVSGTRIFGSNDANDFYTLLQLDNSRIIMEAMNAAGTDAANIIVSPTDITFTKSNAGDYVFDNADLAADAALVSTHSMLIKIGGNQYKVMLVQV